VADHRLPAQLSTSPALCVLCLYYLHFLIRTILGCRVKARPASAPSLAKTGTVQPAPEVLRRAWQATVTASRDAQASPHSRGSYVTAWNASCGFLEAEPWLAISDDVNFWIESLW